MKKVQLGMLVVLSAVFGLAPAFATPIAIANASFEACPTCVNPGGGFTAIPTSSTAMTGWTVVSGDLDWAWPYTGATGWVSQDGEHSLDLNGTTNGTIQQLGFSLTPGTYTLNFWMSAAPGGVPPSERTVGMTVQFKDGVNIMDQQSFLYTVGPTNSRGNMLWQLKSWTFTLAGNADTLVIASNEYGSLGNPTPFGPAIDNISLNRQDEGVPEPGTLSMFVGAGLVAAAALVRRRRS